MFRRKYTLILPLALGLLLLPTMRSFGQAQMNLPLIDPVFQSTWENPAVRPMHRYSLGLPVLSSLETGLISNGFTFRKVTEERDGKLVIIPEKLETQLSKRPTSHLYSEAEIDLLHFRFNIYDWFIWFGARNVMRQNLTYDRTFIQFLTRGNQPGVLDGDGLQLNNLDLDLKEYTEVSLGFSKVAENWTAGFRASYLSGVANIHTINKGLVMKQSLEAADLYAATVEGDVALRMSGVPVDSTGTPSMKELVTPEYLKSKKWFGFSNPGAAVAIGASYSPIRGLNIALSASDLGMIYWTDDLSHTKLKDGKSGTFRGIVGVKKYWKEGTIDFSDYKLSSFFQRDSAGALDPKPYITWLSPKCHVMLTYDVARQTRLGLSFSGVYDMHTFHPSATFMVQQSYSSWFLAQVLISYNQRSFLNVGGALVLTPRPVQFYIATDNLLGLISPTRMRATNVRLGINFVWGTLRGNTKLPHRYAGLSSSSTSGK